MKNLVKSLSLLNKLLPVEILPKSKPKEPPIIKYTMLPKPKLGKIPNAINMNGTHNPNTRTDKVVARLINSTLARVNDFTSVVIS